MSLLLALLNPNTLLAAAAAFAIGFLGGHWQGQAGAAARCRADALQAENRLLAGRLATLSTLAAADAAHAAEAADADAANRRLVDGTPDTAAACLDRAAAGRVRAVR